MRHQRLLRVLAALAAACLGLYVLQIYLVSSTSSSASANDDNNNEVLQQQQQQIRGHVDVAAAAASSRSLAISKNDTYNVWCIFTKVTSNSPIKGKFRILVDSLLKHTSSRLVFHVITDQNSQDIAVQTVEYIMRVNKKSIKVQYYDVLKAARELEDIVSVMTQYFSSKPGTYYSDALFFLSLGLHRIAGEDQDLAVMVDADTKFRVDIKLLFEEFHNFGKDALFGLGPELTPVYRHVLYIYRNKNPKTNFGEPSYLGGYAGYNSGVILFNLKRLRESLEYDQIVGRDSVEHLVKKYDFKGHLGDQDFYTLLGMERPELIHTIDCGWNRQLCTWWKDRGYSDVFANYSRCNSDTKLWHGNCNTPIPND
ncbi:xyloside xylosyltransferase 1 [Trichogramma pretiosum]|uniref:xyloside xylosyltransferase 1 n=1 Tax=Trichogramma pretiosum TaxID=7493 RepID=UPI0006C98E34|nr:xyloside xylosyltransferase 1 [Trichogramma pretiosum]